MKRILLALVAVVLIGLTSYLIITKSKTQSVNFYNNITLSSHSPSASPAVLSTLAIATMKAKDYPGSTINIVQTLSGGSNYSRYIVEYQSDGLTIQGLLTIPYGTKPKNGWPVILFNHGYIPPAQFFPASSYAIMVDPLATAGYIVFMPDYRGNGDSQGTPAQVYISAGYITDSMNALSSIERYPAANPNKIGVLGHSMGGNITLHELLITNNFKAAEILSGVVGSESDILQWWNSRIAAHSIVGNDLDTANVIEQMVNQHGSVQSNPDYWNAIDPTEFISSITTPVEIQVGTGDNEVPPEFSTTLKDKLQADGKTVQYIQYPGADHNLSPYTSQAMSESINFFNKYLK